MRSMDDDLCLLEDRGAIIAQGIIFGSTVVLPLHALDRRELLRRPHLRLLRKGHEPSRLLVRTEFPSADGVLCEIDGPAPSAAPIHSLEDPAQRGQGVEIKYLVWQGQQLTVAKRAAQIRDLVQVRRHDYTSASGSPIRIDDVRVTFLSLSVPRGLSGAPVYAAQSGAIIGFIHGNAEVNGGAAVCLAHRPLRDWLALDQNAC